MKTRKAVAVGLVLLAEACSATGLRAALQSGTSGDDIFFFNGVGQSYIATLINPYTGESINVNDTLNVNQDIYDGLAGTDTILMTSVADLMLLRDFSNNQTSLSVERFVSGDGNDIINLADASFILGNLTLIDGGLANDILWGNVANDTIQGAAGNDTINGGPGNDVLRGQDNDDIFTIGIGSGVDQITGGNGFDEVQFRPGITVADLVCTSASPLAFDVGTSGDHISLDTVEQFRFADNTTADPATLAPEPAAPALVVAIAAATLANRKPRR